VEVWKTSNVRPLRIGEEKKKDNLRKIKRKKKPQDENIMACPIPYRTAMKKKIKTTAAKYNVLICYAGRP